jgi:hypothetical protein
MSESDLEKPPPDSEDQRWAGAEDADQPAQPQQADLPLDVNEADAGRAAAGSEARRGRLPLTAELSRQPDRRPK